MKMTSLCSISTPSQSPLLSIQEVVESYKTLQTLGLKNQDPGFVIKHLARIFDDPNREFHDENKTIANIRKVYEIFKTLSKWDTEGAADILMENLIEVLEQDSCLFPEVTSAGQDEGSNSGQVSSTTDFKMPCEQWDQNNDDHQTYSSFVQGAQITNISMENLAPTSAYSSSSSLFVQSNLPEMSNVQTPLHFLLEKETECNVSSFSCNYCVEMFENSMSLKQHVQLKHSSWWCVLTRQDMSSCFTRNKSPLKTTTTTTSSTGPKEYRCVYCDKEFKNNSHLRDHIRIHTGERPYQCNICGHKFTQSGSLTKHRLIHERKFPCRHCSLSFYEEKSRNRHEELNHQEVEGPKSNPIPDLPPSQLLSSSDSDSDSNSMNVQYSEDEDGNLNSGLDELDEDLEPEKLNSRRSRIHKCPDCPQVFPSSAERFAHVINTHTKQRPFTCTFENCIAAFKQKSTLKQHEKRHEDGTFSRHWYPRNRSRQ